MNTHIVMKFVFFFFTVDSYLIESEVIFYSVFFFPATG